MPDNPIKHVSDDELVYNATRIIGKDSAESSQAELTRRLIESNRELSRSNEHYSTRVLALTIVMALIALLQLLVSTFTLDLFILEKWVLVVCFLLGVSYAFYDLTRGFRDGK